MKLLKLNIKLDYVRPLIGQSNFESMASSELDSAAAMRSPLPATPTF